MSDEIIIYLKESEKAYFVDGYPHKPVVIVGPNREVRLVGGEAPARVYYPPVTSSAPSRPAPPASSP